MKLSRYLKKEGKGSAKKLAKSIGVSEALVSRYVGGKRRIPDYRCVHIEKVTDGGVRCEDIDPDRNWAIARERYGPIYSDKGVGSGEEKTTGFPG